MHGDGVTDSGWDGWRGGGIEGDSEGRVSSGEGG